MKLTCVKTPREKIFYVLINCLFFTFSDVLTKSINQPYMKKKIFPFWSITSKLHSELLFWTPWSLVSTDYTLPSRTFVVSLHKWCFSTLMVHNVRDLRAVCVWISNRYVRSSSTPVFRVFYVAQKWWSINTQSLKCDTTRFCCIVSLMPVH